MIRHVNICNFAFNKYKNTLSLPKYFNHDIKYFEVALLHLVLNMKIRLIIM